MRLLSTGVLNGFMIFLIATEEPVSWSFAELGESVSAWGAFGGHQDMFLGTYHTRPKAPLNECVRGDAWDRVQGKLTHSDGLKVDIARGDLMGDE